MAEITLTIVDEQVVIVEGEDTAEATRQAGIATAAAGTAAAAAATATSAAGTAAADAAAGVVTELEGVLTDIQDAVDEAVTALGSLFTTSYAGTLSQGDRVAALTSNGASITTGLTISGGGNVTNFFNGNTTNDNTGGAVLTGLALTGVVIWQAIFPKGVWQLCDEFQILNSGTQSYGNGVLYGLKPDGTWVSVSADAANGGATTVTRAATAVDKAGYGGFRLVGTSGTAGSGRMLEAKLKLCPGTLNGTVPTPITTNPGKVLTEGDSGVGGDMVWAKPIDYLETRVAGKGLLRSFVFDQNDDEGTLYDRSGAGATIDLATMMSTYGGTISRTQKGRLLESAMFQTATLTSMRTAVMVLIPVRSTGADAYLTSAASNGGLFQLRHNGGGQFASGATLHAGHGGTEVQPVQSNSGQNARKIGRGGPLMIFYEAASAITQKFAVGGLVDTVSASGRITRMEIAYLDIYSGQLDGTDRTFIRRGLRRLMRLRGIYFDHRDCPTIIAMRVLSGQSNANGDAFITEMNANDQLRTWTPHVDMATGIAQSNGTAMFSYSQPSQARLGFNNRLDLIGRMGPEVGMIFAHEEAVDVRPNRAVICKFAVSSTSLDGFWKPSITTASGLFWLMMNQVWDTEQYYLARGIGPKIVGLDWDQWQNDCAGGTDAPSLAYAANIAALWPKFKEQVGRSSGMKMCMATPEDPDVNYNATRFNNVSTAIADFDTANDDVVRISNTGLSYRDSPKIHRTADSYVLWGRRCDAANPSVVS